MNRRTRSIQGGWTLVECSISMTIGTIVFAAAVELLGFALRADSSGGRGLESPQSVDRLAEQFRRDVCSAIAIKPAAPAKAAPSWSMNLPDDRRVVYAWSDDAMLRTEYRGNAVTQREAFTLGGELVPRVELRPAEKPAVAELVLSRVVEGAAVPTDELRIAAPVAWDRRFASPSKSPK